MSKKMKENSCHTYFFINGDFEIEEIEALLRIKPSKFWRKDDLRKDGKPYGFSHFEIGYVDEYDPYVFNMMKKTIEPLKDTINVLLEIQNRYHVEMYLEVVPEIYHGNPTPCLAPDKEVIEFLHEANVEIDIDLYVY